MQSNWIRSWKWRYFFNRGKSKIKADFDLFDVIYDFETAIKINPNKSSFYTERGYVKSQLNDVWGGINDFETAIRINPKDDLALINRCLSKFKLNQYEKALFDCNKAIKLNPKGGSNGYYFKVRGDVNIKLGKDKEARLDYQKARSKGFEINYK